MLASLFADSILKLVPLDRETSMNGIRQDMGMRLVRNWYHAC